MNDIDEIKITSLILYKKYAKLYSWLSYSDLYKLVDRVESKYREIIIPIKKNGINTQTINFFNNKLFPVLEKIEEVKCLRNYTNESRKEMQETEQQKTNDTNIVSNSNSKIHYSNNIPMTEEFSKKTNYIFVDSYDRNKTNWKDINPFSFPMGFQSPSSFNENENDAGIISRSFSNVISISITKIILPKFNLENENIIDKYPYIILSIQEIENKTNGTNDELSHSFGQISCPTEIGNFLHYNYDENESGQMSYFFNTRIEISRLTFAFKTPSGEIIEFQSDDSDENNRIAINIILKSLYKSFTTEYINRPT